MSRRDWYHEIELPSEEHPVDLEVQDRLKYRAEYQDLRAQTLEIGGILRHHLEGEALDLWLRVEAAINDRSALFAEEAYNVGVDAGIAMRLADDILADATTNARDNSPTVVRALAAALARIAQRLG